MRTALTRAYRALADSVSLFATGKLANDQDGFQSGRFGNSASKTRTVPAFFEPLEERRMMSTTYYISNSGNDSNSGTSINSPWKSISKVNGHHLNAGDQALFAGGQTFYGSMNLYNDGGSGTDPLVIGSYGSGKATINSGKSNGIWVLNSTGVTIENLNFVGTYGDQKSQDGIRIENYTGGGVRSGYLVTNCSITGYAEDGIDFGADYAGEGINNLTISYCNVYGNIMNGIESWANGGESNTNVLITNNQVHDNTGNGTASCNGSGIMLQGLNGATVEYNSAYNNGVNGNGGVGIWCYTSNDVVFQYNEAYNNHTRGQDDGDGFDFDSETSNSIMQYNLSLDNDGSGFALFDWMNTSKETGDIVRYNIAQGNGIKNNYSGIDAWGQIINAQIYNNTVYASPGTNGQTSDIRISNNGYTNLFSKNLYVANNIFVSTGNVPQVMFYAAALKGASNIEFAGNDYYSYSGNPAFAWGGSRYSSLGAWQSGTGEEKMNGSATGIYANPMVDSLGGETAQSNPASLTSETAYHLQSSTPILNAGISLNALFNVASPLTGVTTKTIPGVDQSLAGKGGSSSSSGSTTSGSGSSGSSGGGTTVVVPRGTFSSTYLAGWDIGSPNAGRNTESGGTDVVTGGGVGITGSSDSFRYAWTQLTNNGQIVAQITSTSNSSSKAQAGVMIRTSLAANSPEVSLEMNPGDKTATLAWRSAAGGVTDTYSIAANGDQWVKLVRSGTSYNAYISANDSTWTEVGSIYLNPGTTIYMGLAASAGTMGTTQAATYKNVTLTGL